MTQNLVDVTVTGDTNLEAMVQSFEKKYPQAMSELLQHRLSWSVKEIISRTPPYADHDKFSGGLDAGKKAGMENILNDVHKIFKPITQLPFSTVLETKNWEAISAYNFKFKNLELKKALDAGKIDIVALAFKRKAMLTGLAPTLYPTGTQWTSFPKRDFHQGNRGSDGRVPNGTNVAYVPNRLVVNQYAAMVAQSIGKMVGGWYVALKTLGKSYPAILRTGYTATNPYPSEGVGRAFGGVSGQRAQWTAENEYGDTHGILSSNLDLGKLMKTQLNILQSEVGAETQRQLRLLMNQSRKSKIASRGNNRAGTGGAFGGGRKS